MSAIPAVALASAPRVPQPQSCHLVWTIMVVTMIIATSIELLVASLILTFIMPNFAEIFRDFGTQAPWVSRRVMALSQWLDGTSVLFAGWFIAAPLLFLAMGLLVRAALNPARRRAVTLGLLAFSALFITAAVFTWVGTVIGLTDMTAALEAGQANSNVR